MCKSILRILVVGVCCCWSWCGSAQEQWDLHVLPLDRSPEWLLEEVNYETEYPDSLSVISALRKMVGELQLKTYLEASVDTLSVKGQEVLAILHVGPAYQWVRLGKGNVEESLLGQTGFRPRFFNNKAFSQQA